MTNCSFFLRSKVSWETHPFLASSVLFLARQVSFLERRVICETFWQTLTVCYNRIWARDVLSKHKLDRFWGFRWLTLTLWKGCCMQKNTLPQDQDDPRSIALSPVKEFLLSFRTCRGRTRQFLIKDCQSCYLAVLVCSCRLLCYRSFSLRLPETPRRFQETVLLRRTEFTFRILQRGPV